MCIGTSVAVYGITGTFSTRVSFYIDGNLVQHYDSSTNTTLDNTTTTASNVSISARQLNATTMLYGTSLLESQPLEPGEHRLVIQPDTDVQESGRNIVLLDYLYYKYVYIHRLH